MFLSRLQFSNSPTAQALSGFWRSPDSGQRRSAQHNIMWSVFAKEGNSEQERDFLWREEGEGSFIALSHRPPMQNDLFKPHVIKEFAPRLKSGDRLAFKLRANATRSLENAETGKSRRLDVVTYDLLSYPMKERGLRRRYVAQSAGTEWIKRQGGRHGFEIIQNSVTDYKIDVLPRFTVGPRCTPKFGIIDMTGLLVVTDPKKLWDQIIFGFGRAKSFGCGLMLLRASS